MKNLNVKATAKNIICGQEVEVVILSQYNETSYEVEVVGTNMWAIVRAEDLTIKTVAGVKKIATANNVEVVSYSKNVYHVNGATVLENGEVTKGNYVGSRKVLLHKACKWLLQA